MYSAGPKRDWTETRRGREEIISRKDTMIGPKEAKHQEKEYEKRFHLGRKKRKREI